MISHFFIDRPIFASVLSIVLVIAGTVAMISLPISLYPPIAPPTIQVSVTYPGASAEVVADTVAAPIEQQVNGVDNMIYMSSTCDNTGYYNLTVTFAVGTNLDLALVNVQNRVNLAVPQLPHAVSKQGLTIKKKTPDILLVINFFSPDKRYDDLYLSNYATIHVKDEIFRLPGVSDINYLGQRDYSIRVWLDPQQLAARNISTSEVVHALKNQNYAVSPGSVGQQPAAPGRSFQQPLDVIGRLRTTEEFANIIIRAEPGGAGSGTPGNPNPSPAAAFTRLGDVARVEFGAVRYDQTAGMDDKVSVALAIYQLPGSNALDVAASIQKKMKELAKKFPEGLAYEINYDTTPFISDSIKDVVKTLIDAVILVAIVVLVFLQNWRATIIPLIAVPVAIIGTFAAMAALGISINTISLFGLVLAIGIVVDDAIVVVENVERWLEVGYTPRDAARKAMEEVTGPVVAVALVLCAVFVPCAFISGITGQFFRQFAVTISVSTVISAFNSLTLSPALASILLRPRRHGFDWVTFGLFLTVGALLPFYLRASHGLGESVPLALFLPVSALLGAGISAGVYLSFNRVFDVGTAVYTRIVGWAVRLALLVLIGYGGLLYLTYDLSQKVPKGFIPIQDQGYLVVNIQLPDSASVQRTQEVLDRVDRIARGVPGVSHTVSTAGYSFLLSVFGSNFGGMFIVLDDFDNRKELDKNGFIIMFKLRAALQKEIQDAIISVFPAPPVKGLGTAGGFKFMVEDRGDLGAMALQDSCTKLIQEGTKNPGIAGMFTMYSASSPQLYADIDRDKARALGVPIAQVNEALQAFLGSIYVNNMNAFGRFWQVNIMADLQYRNRFDTFNLMMVRNARGDMVPLSTLIDLRDTIGPGLVMRYNLYRAAAINGNSRTGFSSGTVMEIIDDLGKKELPRSMAIEWTELSFLERAEAEDWRNQVVFPLAVVLVFLVLAAQYESWSLPLAVILVVPMCLLCSLAGLLFAGKYIPQMDLNIFTQIGFVVLVGLASKNAILIVEFARQLRSEGKPLFEATVEACQLRLRPILMTSFAFILGVVPLVIAKGAGAEMRRALGVAVFSGMLGVTVFGIFLTPVFFFVIQWFGDRSEGSTTARTGSRLLWYLACILSLGLLPLLSALLGGLRRGRPRLSDLTKPAPPPEAAP
ncbi:MAG: multidrug efflux RND transporter permease subunit [Gemmataceae bacterium]